MDLKTFLLARITEDEAEANGQLGAEYYTDGAWPEEVAARVLAECVAKRAIVELHSKTTYSLPITQGDDSLEYWHNHTDLVEVRENGHLVEQITTAEWLERVGAVLNPPADELRALAAVYADHADYQPEWAQEASQA